MITRSSRPAKALLGLAAASLTAATVVSGAASADPVTVVAWGGSYQDTLRKEYFEPFSAETGLEVIEDSWGGGIGVLRTKVESGAVDWDIVQVESEELALGCEEGLFVPIDWDMMGGRDAFIEQGSTECGVGTIVWSTILAYDTSVFPDGPTSWADFWDLERFPGKRGLRKGPKFALEVALYADGVPVGEIYEVLSTDEGVDRAFAKLDEIKSEIVWWESGAQPPQLLAAGEVAMTAAYNGRIYNAMKAEGQPFKIIWAGSLFGVDSWVILDGGPNTEGAMQMVAYMSQPDVQARIPEFTAYGVTHKAAAEQIPAELLAELPSHPDNLAVQIPIDTDFWVNNIESLNERFNSWVAE